MEIQFSVPVNTAKKKTSAAKRHVKCDESRPACLNCLKWRGYCDSYADAAEPRPLKKTPTANQGAKLVRTHKPPLLITEPAVNTIRFANSEQRAYFDEWSKLSMAFLSGGLGQTRLWSATMPQVSSEETTLRYGAMAVGALRKAYELASPSMALTTGNKHYLNAVIYYCEALRRQAKAVPTREGLRTALLSSLLFICFEAQRGNMPAALKHVTHGFSMLNELAACTDLAPSLVSIAQAPPALVQEILDCYKPLELQSRSFMGSYKKFFFPPTPARAASSPGVSRAAATGHAQLPASPDGPAANYDIMQRAHPSPSHPRSSWQSPPPASTLASQTGLLSPQSRSGSATAPRSHSPPPGARRLASIAPFTKHSPYFRPRQSNITTLDNMPQVFKDLEEAQGYWSLVQKAMVTHLPMLTMVTSQLGLTRTVSEAELDMKLRSVKQNPRITRFIAETRYWISRWAEAIEPVRQAIWRNSVNDHQTYLQAVNLRIEYLILYVYTTVPRFSGLVTAKGLTPQYREINRLAETLLMARPNCGFAMDSGWTWPLFISSFSCRDGAVRRDAIRILGQYPIRNALRDSRVFRAIAMRNQEVEEQTVLEGTEHEQWLGLRRRELVFEDFGTTIIYRSAQKNRSTGDWELVEEVAQCSALSSDGKLDWLRQPVSDSASIMSGVC
ncbi:C6 zinc finger domain protein [Metarhizium album ARSEF 1941]|uniref:C6 zinc finger domain protein n=1 Tax=Metarhizium album (strain ARSEF 1941) TaxID=1081103 RepID=A0A0B2WN11_METAS|nr:C6 zinc finger domain protein [Metarhizium album ARSEF 1941]KHN94400.1 C6 zinc finger domain protein [Metarhizium album ARSEF 1941]